MREGAVDAGTKINAVDWNVATILAARAHLHGSMMDENVAAERLPSDMPADDTDARLYEELWEAEHVLRTSYEQSQGGPYPLPEINFVIGSEIY